MEKTHVTKTFDVAIECKLNIQAFMHVKQRIINVGFLEPHPLAAVMGQILQRTNPTVSNETNNF